MPGSADFIQRAVHALEAGGLAVWIRRSLIVAVVVAAAVFYIWHFRGLATSQAMDQAQIGRSIASGRGWQTQLARPLAITQLKAHGRDVKRNIWFDTYNAPLPPLINAIALLPVKSHWQMGPTDLIGTGDKAIATLAVLLFVASLFVIFLTIRRLFDQRIAAWATVLVFLSDMIWQYSISGLPQMLLLLLFNATLYVLVRAVQTRETGQSSLPWLAATGLGFGLLALSHALTIWMFAGAFAFSMFFFPGRLQTAAVLLGVFLIAYAPWLIRNQVVCGSPFGMSAYAALDGVRFSEAAWMRSAQPDFQNVGPGAFRDKMINNSLLQTGRLPELLGFNVAALAFFFALLHGFKRPETAALRWFVLAMWGGAFLGISIYGLREEQGYAANQLHLLFLPIMISYGLAFLLVLWNRLEFKTELARPAFFAGLLLICAFPMINTTLLARRKPMILWPPYLPPYIGVLHAWMKPDEIIASDMPWAVAWYADRRSVWLPDTVQALIDLSDFNVLGGPIHGLYLTSISGAQNTLRDLNKGEYKEWAPYILHTANLEKFPLPYPTLGLGIDNECVFFSNSDRTKLKPQ